MARISRCNIYAQPILQAAYQYLYHREGLWDDVPKHRYETIEPDRWMIRLPKWWEYTELLGDIDLEESLSQFNDSVYGQVWLTYNFFIEQTLMSLHCNHQGCYPVPFSQWLTMACNLWSELNVA